MNNGTKDAKGSGKSGDKPQIYRGEEFTTRGNQAEIFGNGMLAFKCENKKNKQKPDLNVREREIYIPTYK